MFEISELKAKKLPELQELAKALNVPKYRSLKKLDLVYQILDYQAANPNAVKAVANESTPTEKPAQSTSEKTEETKETPSSKPQQQRAPREKDHLTLEVETVTQETIGIKKINPKATP